MIDQGCHDGDKSETVYYPVSHDLFFIRTDECEATSSDEIDQGKIHTNVVSEIVGAKHGEAVFHRRWRWIAIPADRGREIPLECKGQWKRLKPLFQFLFQLIRKSIV